MSRAQARPEARFIHAVGGVGERARMGSGRDSRGAPDCAVLFANGRVRQVLGQDLGTELTWGVVSRDSQLTSPLNQALARDAVLLEVPGSLSYRALVTRTVSAACRVASAAAPAPALGVYVNELVSAVGEVFNNVAIHGYPAERSGTVRVIIESTGEGMLVELQDSGITFDPTSVDLPESLEPSESGMGVFIVFAFVDRVEYVPGSPNSLRLFKRFPWLA